MSRRVSSVLFSMQLGIILTASAWGDDVNLLDVSASESASPRPVQAPAGAIAPADVFDGEEKDPRLAPLPGNFATPPTRRELDTWRHTVREILEVRMATVQKTGSGESLDDIVERYLAELRAEFEAVNRFQRRLQGGVYPALERANLDDLRRIRGHHDAAREVLRNGL